MRLKELLKKDCPLNVEYRTFGPNGEDLFIGSCFWNGEQLIPYDNDYYDVEDEISGFVENANGNLTIWYESKWVYG